MTPEKTEIDQGLVTSYEVHGTAKEWVKSFIKEVEDRTERKVVGVIVDKETAHLLLCRQPDGAMIVLADNGGNGWLETFLKKEENKSFIVINWGGPAGTRNYWSLDYLSKITFEGGRERVGLVNTNDFLKGIDLRFFPALKEKLEKVTNQGQGEQK